MIQRPATKGARRHDVDIVRSPITSARSRRRLPSHNAASKECATPPTQSHSSTTSRASTKPSSRSARSRPSSRASFVLRTNSAVDTTSADNLWLIANYRL